MTLKHLQIFSEVCRNESITSAADTLNMAQPAVSRAVRELENYYRVTLFERMNRRLYLTSAGECLLSYARSILEQMAEAKEAVPGEHACPPLRIGCNASFGSGHLPGILLDFKTSHPEITVYTLVQNSRQIESALLSNELDIGMIDLPLHPDSFETHFQIPDTMTALYYKKTAEHPLPLNELLQFPLLVREPGSGSRALVDQLFLNAEQKPWIAMESISTDSLIAACQKGLGVLFLPASTAKPYLDSGLLFELPLENITLKRSYYLLTHKKKFINKSILSFIEQVKAQ